MEDIEIMEVEFNEDLYNQNVKDNDYSSKSVNEIGDDSNASN